MDELTKLRNINTKLHLALNCAIDIIEENVYHEDIQYSEPCKRMKRLIKEINKLEGK